MIGHPDFVGVMAAEALGLDVPCPRPRARPNFYVEKAKTPAGHPVLVVYGARWRKDAMAPVVDVMAYRVLPNGDAIGYAHERIIEWGISEQAKALAPHSYRMAEAVRPALASFGLDIPERPEPNGAFAVATYMGMVV